MGGRRPQPLDRGTIATRRSSGSSLTGAQDQLSARPLAETRSRREQDGATGATARKFSLGNVRSRSSSTEAGCSASMPLPTLSKESLSSEQRKKDEEKTFSVTILVNEHEKNKIVDLLHKAKSIISKKVEKVMGKKPKSGITNVDALQTVLESWMSRAESEEREDTRMVEKLIKEQEKQVETLLQHGQPAPVTYPLIPTVEVNSDEASSTELGEDMEVARLTTPRLLKPPDRRSRPEPPSPRCLSPVEVVPCPFGNRPDSELYPPRLRRPSSLYGAGAAAASSRPPSRQVSVSPSVLSTQEREQELQEETGALEDTEEWEYEEDETIAEVDEYEEEEIPRYTRPDSFIVPIGGTIHCYSPVDQEVKWSTVEPVREEELVQEKEAEVVDARRSGGEGEEACAVSCVAPTSIFSSPLS